MLRSVGLFVILLVGWSGSQPLEAQEIVGRAVDADTGAPIPFVVVRTLNPDDEVTNTVGSGLDGIFRTTVQPGAGTMRLRIEALSYETLILDSLAVDPGESLNLGDVALTRAPILLDELRADVDRPRISRGSDWVRRNQLHGEGTFLPGALVALSPYSSIGAYVASETALWSRLDSRGRAVLWNPAGALGRCVDVLVNRWPLELTGYGSLDDVPRADIAAIEIYESYRQRPPGYTFEGRPDCGLVNVWLWNSW